MDLSKLKGCELMHRHGMENKMLIEIPNTKAHLVLDFNSKGINAYAIELGSTKRSVLGKNLTKKQVNHVVEVIFNDETQPLFKNKKFKDTATQLINTLNQF